MTKDIFLSPQKKMFLVSIAGGAIGALLVIAVQTIKSSKYSPVSCYGMVNRESLIQGKAKEIAKEKVTEEVLIDKLTHFIEQYDVAVRELSQEKQVLLLDKNAFASQAVPDFTEELRLRMNQAESHKK